MLSLNNIIKSEDIDFGGLKDEKWIKKYCW